MAGDHTATCIATTLEKRRPLPVDALFFLDRSILQNFTALPLGAFIAQAVVVMVAWAVVYGQLWLLTRSIWPAVLMHSGGGRVPEPALH